jgi:hypothetical protein
MAQRKQEGRAVHTKLPLELHKAFKHKLIDTEWDADEALLKLIEMWVEGKITLPDRPSRPARSKRK